MKRRETKQIHLGKVAIGGGAPISVQSMTNTDTRDPQATLAQIDECARNKCDIIRCAVPDEAAARALKEICAASPLPVVADIHFDYKLALAAIEAGAHGLRLNPGNIGGREKVEAVVAAAKERAIPIRIGVNAGSISPTMRRRVEAGELALPDAMAESALEHVRILEDAGFDQIKISLKASDVLTTVAAYRALAPRVPYPFHAGVTEAGTARSGAIKSAAGIGVLLMEGLADTLRVSLTAPPAEEVYVGREILKSFGYLTDSYRLISCPTCGRTQINIQSIATKIEDYLIKRDPPLTVAVMGCIVNGPGEARHADVGIAGGKGRGVVYRRGRIVRECNEQELTQALMDEIERVAGERSGAQ